MKIKEGSLTPSLEHDSQYQASCVSGQHIAGLRGRLALMRPQYRVTKSLSWPPWMVIFQQCCKGKEKSRPVVGGNLE